MKIKSNDKVQLIAGKDKGKKGKVLQVLSKDKRIVVEGLNLLVKHMRPKKQGEKGQKILFPAPLNISNVKLVCPKCSKLARIGYKILENKKKVRICKKCKEIID